MNDQTTAPQRAKRARPSGGVPPTRPFIDRPVTRFTRPPLPRVVVNRTMRRKRAGRVALRPPRRSVRRTTPNVRPPWMPPTSGVPRMARRIEAPTANDQTG